MSSNPIGANFTYPLGKTVITASQVGVPISVPLGGSFQQSVWIEASNETPYILSIFSAQGILLNQIQPQLQDIAQIPSGDTSFIIVASLLLPQAAPSSEVDINVYPFGKPTGAYPIPLGRQAAPTSQYATAGFEASQNFGGTPANAGVGPVINVHNAGNSTKKGTFTLARIVILNVTGTSSPQLEMGWYTGADGTGGGAILVQPNNTVNTNILTATASSLGGNRPAGANIYQLITLTTMIVNTPYTYDFILFPNQKELPPNTNFYMFIHNLSTAISGILVFGWSEG